jgi:hypothetical protein
MGGASSGGSDNDVSGAEAVATGGTTYNSRKLKNAKGKSINKQIAETNQKNRDDRRSPIAKILSKTPGGVIMNKISNSKFVQDSNYKSRFRFAQKSGKFKDTPLTREFVLSKGFKNQLDGMGYSDRNNTGGNDNRDDNNNQTVLATNTEATQQVASSGVVTNNEVIAPTNAEVTQAKSTDMSADQILVANNKKARSNTILKTASGLGDSTLQTTKKKLGA